MYVLLSRVLISLVRKRKCNVCTDVYEKERKKRRHVYNVVFSFNLRRARPFKGFTFEVKFLFIQILNFQSRENLF